MEFIWTRKKIILALKEHNPKISELHSDIDLHNFLTGLEVVGVVAVEAVQNAINAINKLGEIDPQFKQLIEMSKKFD
jgi:hypothetical protein